MSFAAAAQAFAAQAARERVPLGATRIQPYTGARAATPDGPPIEVFLSPIRAEREFDDRAAGWLIVHRAQLRVLKSCRWQPAEGREFVVLATSERFRCRTATGADSPLSAEVVCDCDFING